ncbi:hypothetical protein SAMN02799622_02036 [Methylobacterium sp. UNC378MF]|uniref:hypothetical protein n=1 Tax=Methylobacterium sp. UNC378MF TaxID=1502748 RepID=UPI0008874ACF|nr:hypothetical protein [Methylobacterium sp. UNC378MF]SDA18461.1 hypothetical protein SAMN02799622_02036 [Methylobacterium sp. UNC378MF]
MRKPNTAKAAPEARDLRQRAARARDAAGRFIKRPVDELRFASQTFTAPSSTGAMAAWHAACREHSIRTAPLQDCPALMRENGDVWSTRSLFQALEAGDITVSEYVRLHPLASERELRFAQVAHELNLGSLFASAYADEYPIEKFEPASAEAPTRHQLSPDRAWVVAQATAVDLSDLTIVQLHNLYDHFDAVAEIWCAVSSQPWANKDRGGWFRNLNAGGRIVDREEDRAAEIRNRIAAEIQTRTPTSELERDWRLETLIKFELLCETSLRHAPELRAEIAQAWGA